ncbi:Alpha/Beta hydrolase protein [Talaromyces proteolyticus]|uniref:Alpha/Beta hydrolase protein n=1 Tax=Talaromyces proteolyticus TaxID=1131652 RepID=A0AAD4L1I2_9EURO|nr:Alpha/Beta hydrolase protein [Talaromyces proteolyticus]KAH8705842.1 Alpha/Beta hydrolase protein [Talaromyces proteolyticus]
MLGLRFILSWFSPLYDALLCPSIPLRLRLSLLGLQPLNLLTYPMKWIPYLFSREYSVESIPLRHTPGQSLRVLVFGASSPTTRGQKRPLHLDIHGGGFVGGIPELDIPFCKQVANETGAVVVSISYRLAPRHTFPIAHTDAEDIAEYIVRHAENRWGADPKRMMTVSGFSVGGNLALAVAQFLGQEIVKGSVTFYTPVDFRLPPWERPKPPGFPQKDPLAFLASLFDSYVGACRMENIQNQRLHPTLATRDSLPKNMLFVIPKVDILLDEQTKFVQRLESESSKGGRVEAIFFEGQIHGWLELPSFAINEETRRNAFDAAISFIRDVQRES